MKKLMIAAAMVCAAAFAQAAAIDWSASNVADPVATAAGGKAVAANGWLGYVVLSADLGAVQTALSTGDTSVFTDGDNKKYVGASKTTNDKGQFLASSAAGTVAAGSQDFYLVILDSGTLADAKNYYVSGKVTQTVDSSLDTSVAFSKQGGTSSTSNWTAMAPEPTSGLLLLIGMGALALRRRHA